MLFEQAVDAIVSGEEDALRALLLADPSLIHARSTRPHGAALIHYCGANGVEDERQKTPTNAVKVLRILLEAGAEVDAIIDAYGKGSTLGLVATSVHPVIAGVQLDLLQTLLDAGAAIDGPPGTTWNPLVSALHNGRGDAAAFLADRGAKLDMEGAAGTGRLDDMRRLAPEATGKQKEYGLMWACQYGHPLAVAYLLDECGVSITATPGGETALHWAAYAGNPEIVQMLLDRGAPVNTLDSQWQGTPLRWAEHSQANTPPEPASWRDFEAVKQMLKTRMA
jgi:hypothetical protein